MRLQPARSSCVLSFFGELDGSCSSVRSFLDVELEGEACRTGRGPLLYRKVAGLNIERAWLLSYREIEATTPEGSRVRPAV